MKWVIFGLTMSSSWGNGHATLWRGLCRSLVRRGHEVIFYEKDVPYYAAHRDLKDVPGMQLRLYSEWVEIQKEARRHLDEADVGMVTSYCPDALPASRLVLESRAKLRTFYDLDAPVTLERVLLGQKVEYIPETGLGDFDLVLSYTGGRTLRELQLLLGARKVAPLYGSVDPEVHQSVRPRPEYRSDLSYIGTFAQDRQAALEALFLEPARCLPDRKFYLAGSMYPGDFPWRDNIFYKPHLAPPEHSAFYCSSRLTLNITRGAMARMGYCPSGRIFEAASCGVPILSDYWEGLDQFYHPGTEILIARDTSEAVAAIDLSDRELKLVAQAARARTFESHTAERRAQELVEMMEAALTPRPAPQAAPQLETEEAEIHAFTGSSEKKKKRAVWGIVPSAGAGSRIQPLAFSKELLPVGSRIEGGVERPRAVSEFLVERMIKGGATQICFVISPGKSDILEYYGGRVQAADICYTVQPKPAGLCDAIFRAVPLIQPEDQVLIGLPDTVWYPEDGFNALPEDALSFLLFPVKRPEFFDAVVTDASGRVLEIEVKKPKPRTHWIWGAFRMPGHVFQELHRLWRERNQSDEYMGTLVNEYIRRGGDVRSVRAGEAYVDVGTLHGYREAIQVLVAREAGLRVELSA